MINPILAIWTPGPIEILIVLIILCTPVALIIWFLKILSKRKNENIRLRLEVGKLADEIEKTRKGKQSKKDND